MEEIENSDKTKDSPVIPTALPISRTKLRRPVMTARSELSEPARSPTRTTERHGKSDFRLEWKEKNKSSPGCNEHPTPIPSSAPTVRTSQMGVSLPNVVFTPAPIAHIQAPTLITGTYVPHMEMMIPLRQDVAPWANTIGKMKVPAIDGLKPRTTCR